MSTVYRSYEVLIEETARNHHARKAGKTKKELHPNHLNTEQALKTTHEVFQDAVCYYILCMLGLIENGKDATGKTASPLWSCVTSAERLSETHELVKRLAEGYPAARFSRAKTVEEFHSACYGAFKAKENIFSAPPSSPNAEPRRNVFLQLLEGAIKTKGEKSSLTEMNKFANDWIQRIANPKSGQSGAKEEARNNRYWMRLQKITDAWSKAGKFDDSLLAEKIQLKYCFKSAVEKVEGEEALKIYGKAFDVSASDQDEDSRYWEPKLATVTNALERLANPKPKKDGSIDQPVSFKDEQNRLRTAAKLYVKGSDGEFKLSCVKSKEGYKPGGVYWLALRYKYSPSEITRNHLLSSLRSRKATSPEDALEDYRSKHGAVFPFFTNLLGIKKSGDAASVWPKFDRSAFKRAAEEVFKYRLRSDERARLFKQRHDIIQAMETDGVPPINDELHKLKKKNSRPRNLGGLAGDGERQKAMEELLAKVGGQIGYGLRRATIGGWAELRAEFLKYARTAEKEGVELDEDELIEIVNKAQRDSAGGFGSAPFFRELCKEENHILWLPKANNLPEHCPKNFVRWWVRYSEAKEELAKIATLPNGSDDWKDAELKPISFTWPGTKNRHNEESFRPLDFECELKQRPAVQLFHREKKGEAIKLVKTNSQWVEGKNGKWDWKLDLAGDVPYPMTLSFRRLMRDKLVTADGNSFESSYGIPLAAVGETPLPDMQADSKTKTKQNLAPSVSLLPPEKFDGPFHLMFAFDVEAEALQKDTKRLPGDGKSLRTTKKNGKWVGLNFRWSGDEKVEAKGNSEPVTSEEGQETPESGSKFKVKEIWSELDTFEPFDILSIDLGVRFTAAWSRNQISLGEKPSARAREISPHGHKHQIWFDSYQRGVLKLQGEDAEEYRKEKGQACYSEKPLPEKYGTNGRLASDAERSKFLELAKAILPENKRNSLPEAEDQKFFPLLGDHLTWRLRRRIGRLKFLFTLRWRAVGKKDRFEANDYRAAGSEADWKVLREKNLYKAIECLAFQPEEADAGEEPEVEEQFMEKLRHALCSDDEIWKSLSYEHAGKTFPLFRKVSGKMDKADLKAQKEAQKKAQDELRKGLADKSDKRWKWEDLATEAGNQIKEVMKAIEGQHGWIAEVAQFVWPLRDKEWIWHPCRYDVGTGELLEQSFLERDEQSVVTEKRHIRGMRGLNMRRIEVLQDFRRCLQSLAKIERRFHAPRTDYGLEPSKVERGDIVHEPAQAFLENINELREQRVFQTAHMILAEALGLQLMNPGKVEIEEKGKKELKSERDLHGRYEPKLDKDGKPLPRVSAIVLEDLGRYKTSQDRSRFENRQLMEWSHGKVLAKLQDMAQVFGIEIILVDARFSSRYSSRTGAPGVRCKEVSKGFAKEQPWRRWSEEKVGKGKDREPSKRARFIQEVAEKLDEIDDPKAALWLPLDGGPAFVPTVSHDPNKEGIECNADINAAVAVGLRALAHPDRLDIFPVIRTEAKAGGELEIQNRRGSLSEALTKNAENRTVRVVEPEANSKSEKAAADENVEDEDGDDELETTRKPYLYAAVTVDKRLSVELANNVRFRVPLAQNGELVKNVNDGCSAAKGKEYWTRVKNLCWERINAINAARIKAWKEKDTLSDSDDIPK